MKTSDVVKNDNLILQYIRHRTNKSVRIFWSTSRFRYFICNKSGWFLILMKSILEKDNRSNNSDYMTIRKLPSFSKDLKSKYWNIISFIKYVPDNNEDFESIELLSLQCQVARKLRKTSRLWSTCENFRNF